uniref:NADH dehydrogenase subunit 2 n=1 Tax=Nephrocerus lapponicus TaxID=1255202 RepID=UPI0026E38CA6|nr:NADH dehydrogenase subunit 2 [Nephrocerus lapponicus]WJW73736.1 NADH dehydrogenase subunit 2 [Nephrocerus lapponicus]
MFNNSYKIMFLLMLILGTMISVSSNSWLSTWMGLEINLLSFIPLMKDNKINLMSAEASLKYFLTQALASSVLLMAIIMFMMKYNLIFSLNNYFNYENTMILSSLLLKSGTAPFHWWFTNVLEGLSWMNSLILMTWQKLAPLMLISYIVIKPMILFCIISSVIIGSLGGLNQTSLRKLMAFSSINHLGWMLMAMYFNESMWMLYFCFYSFLSFNLVFLFNLFKLYHINQLFSLFFKNKLIKFFLFLNFLSLGGLPPFMGFIPKWLTIQQLIMNNQLLMIFILLMTSLITLFFYLRLCYTTFMLNYFEMNFIFFSKMNNLMMKSYLLLSFISTFGLMLISLIFMIF